MSLKAFHILFIVLSIILAFGFGIWEIRTYAVTNANGDLWMAIGSFVAGILLVVYAIRVIRKLKNVSAL